VSATFMCTVAPDFYIAYFRDLAALTSQETPTNRPTST